jgi:signal transduction histidine kinase
LRPEKIALKWFILFRLPMMSRIPISPLQHLVLVLLLFGRAQMSHGQTPIPGPEPPPAFTQEEIVYQYIKSGIARYSSDRDSALISILNGIEASRALKFVDGMFTGYFFLGIFNIYQGEYEAAKMWLEKAAEQAYASGKTVANVCRTLNNLGNVQHFRGDYQGAASYYFYAINIAENAWQKEQDTNVLNPLVRLYTSTAHALLQLDEDQKAEAFLQKGEALATQMGYAKNMPGILVNKALVARKKGDYATAWNHVQEALTISRAYDLDEPEHIALQSLGDLLFRQGKYTEAIHYLDQALKVQGYVNPFYEVQTLLSLGTTYRSINQLSKAEQALLAAYGKAEKLKIPAQLLLIHQQLARLYGQTRQYRQAFEHQRIAFEINDSLLNSEKTKAVNLLEVKYRTAEKEKEITQKQLLINAQQKILQKKNIWIVSVSSGALLLMAIAGLLYSLYNSNKQKQRLQNEKIRTIQQQQEINLLKALMEGEEKERVRIAQDLHDGIVVQFTAAKMSLRSLSNHHKDLVGSEDFKAAISQLDQATRNLRQTAHNLLPDILLEEGLAEAVYYFCKNLKQNTGLEIDFQLYGQIPRLTPDFELSVYRIIQELVHNIIKHAKARLALVQITCQDRHLSITVEDDGVGIPSALLNERKGFGLRTVRARVKTLMGHLDVRSEEGKGTIVYLEFDIQNSLNQIYTAGIC